MQLHLGRALGDPEGQGNGRLREVVDVPQEQQLTVMRGQIPNRSAHIDLERQEIEAPSGGPVMDVAVLIEADCGCVTPPVTMGFAVDDRAQPGDRMLGNYAIAEAAPGANQGLLGDVGSVVGGGYATGFAQASRGCDVPVEFAF